jgi:hypothetical protein
MRHSATRCLVMAACATAAVFVATANEADARDRHVRLHRHHRTSIGFDNLPTGTIAPAVVPARTDVCPGNARAIDCTVWPPPFDDDPDRKATSSDGGG